jgi:hypothetical protein
MGGLRDGLIAKQLGDVLGGGGVGKRGEEDLRG